MRLDRLTVQNWRNIAQADFRPGPGLTVLCGDNGQGKTNLLEAVWSLTGGKSFRASRDAELIRQGAEFSVLEGSIFCEDRLQTLRLTVGSPASQKPGRNMSRNGMPPVRAASLAGLFTAVVFDPNHLSLIKGGPEGRRRFLDTALCQLYPAYLKLLRRYSRIVTQKNSLLKECRGRFSLSASQSDLLEIYDQQLAEAGQALSLRRQKYLEELAPLAVANYSEISSGREQLALRYLPSFGPEGLLECCRQKRSEEIRSGFCLAGPHREDFEVTLDGRSARVFGSQGQQRSAVLSLKLAEAAQAARIREDSPVMLMDDVLSELDEKRRAWLLTRMEGRQTIVTACDSAEFLKTSGILYAVSGGEIRPL